MITRRRANRFGAASRAAASALVSGAWLLCTAGCASLAALTPAAMLASVASLWPHAALAADKPSASILRTFRVMTMNQPSLAAAQALQQLPDEAFHSASDAPFAGIAKTLDSGSEPPTPVLALGLPRVIDIERNTRIPGALALRYTGQRQWEVDVEQNLHCIVVDLKSGAVRTSRPFRSESRRMAAPTPSRHGSPPPETERTSFTHGIERFELPASFGREWPSRAFAVTPILYDWLGNTLVVERRPAPALVLSQPRAPTSFLEPAAPAPAAGAAPAGLSLAVPGTAQAGAALRIAGTYSGPRDAIASAPLLNAPDSAALVAELLLVKLDAAKPISVPLVIAAKSQGDAIAASFAFDLAKRPEAADLAGEYQVYLVSGRSVAAGGKLVVQRR